MAVAGPTLVSDRSAEVWTVLLTEDVLLAVLGSGVALGPVLAALAVLVSVLPLGTLGLTWRTRVNVSVAPAGSVEPSGGPLSWVNDTRVVFAGGVSVVWTAWASDGPLLVVVIV